MHGAREVWNYYIFISPNKSAGFCLYCNRGDSAVMQRHFPITQWTTPHYKWRCKKKDSMLHDILGHDHIQWHPRLISHFNKSWPYYQTWPYHRFWRYYLIPGGFHRTFAKIAASQMRRLTPPDIWDLNSFLCFNLDHSFLNLPCLRTFWDSNIPRYMYLYFAWDKITVIRRVFLRNDSLAVTYSIKMIHV